MSVLSLLNPFGWFGYRAKLSGGGAPGQDTSAFVEGNDSGVRVTPVTALQLETYWACVRLIAQTIGTLPMILYNVAANGSRTAATDNPLYQMLLYQPNPYHSATEFWEGVGAYLCVWGNAYAQKLKAGDRTVGLKLLRSEWMNVFLNAQGIPVYRYSDPILGQTDYGQADLLHVRGFGFGDFVGLSPLAFGAQTIGRAVAANEAAGSLFRNGLKMGGFFKYKGGANGGVLNEEQKERAKKALVEPFQGAAAAGKVGLLPADFDWVSMAMNPVDAELMNNRRMSVEEICRFFGIPPIMIGHTAQGQTMWGSGVEHINLAFMTTGLRPFLHRIEAAITRDLIGVGSAAVIDPEFYVEELLRGDSKGQADVDLQLVNSGIMTRNEVRKRRNLPPIKGGDDLTVNSAMLPVDMLREVAKLPKDKPVGPGADVGLDPVPAPAPKPDQPVLSRSN